MSNHAGMFSLDRPWAFPGWDNLKSSVPPWEHRGFWYHNGNGDFIVFIWVNSFDEAGYPSYSGHIYRHTDIIQAITTLETYRGEIELGHYDGALIFYGRRRPSKAVIGRQFPESLPDNRW